MMNYTCKPGGVIINPRYRRPAVLRALANNLGDYPGKEEERGCTVVCLDRERDTPPASLGIPVIRGSVEAEP